MNNQDEFGEGNIDGYWNNNGVQGGPRTRDWRWDTYVTPDAILANRDHADNRATSENLPRYLRLKRAGNDWFCFRSRDGENWWHFGTLNGFDLPATILLGTATSHRNQTDYSNFGDFAGYPDGTITQGEVPEAQGETIVVDAGTSFSSSVAVASTRGANYFSTTIGSSDEAITGSGRGLFVLDGTSLSVNINYYGLLSDFTNIHIHGPAADGESAGVLVPLKDLHVANPAFQTGYNGGWPYGGINPEEVTTAGQIIGTVEISEENAAHIRSGMTYPFTAQPVRARSESAVYT